MATRKVSIRVPGALIESIKERVGARGVPAYIAAAAAHQDAVDRLRVLSDRLEAKYGLLEEQEVRTALDRIAAIDTWHSDQPPGSAA